ncbi:alginate O-acetyltransferase AlgX-related protein [Thermostilla marina]
MNDSNKRDSQASILRTGYALARAVKKQITRDYGGKDVWIRMGGIVEYFCMRSGRIGDVIIGKDGWLFYYNGEVRRFIESENVRSVEHVTNWRATFEQEADVCRDVGAPYVVVIGPNKSTIYPELLPTHVGKPGKGTVTDRLCEVCRSVDNLAFVDVRNVLKEAKSAQQTYYMTDTHWNEFGAYLCAQSIGKALGPLGETIVDELKTQYEISAAKQQAGDLARMIGIREILQEDAVRVRPANEELRRWFWLETANISRRPELTRFRTVSSSGEIERVVIFRDSFATALLPYLGPHFKEAYWIWNNHFDEGLVRELRPTLVIRVMVERVLANEPPSMIRTTASASD